MRIFFTAPENELYLSRYNSNIKKATLPDGFFYVWLLHMDCPRHRFALLVPPHSFAIAHRRSSDRLSFVVEPLPRGSNRKHNSNTKKPPFQMAFLRLAASHGFEPRLTESESAVLPLDDEAIERKYLYRNPLPMSRDFIKKNLNQIKT